MGWQLIQSFNVGDGTTSSPSASLTFTNIPQTYKSLKLVGCSRSLANAVGDSFYIYPNGSSANASGRTLEGNGSSAVSNTFYLGRINGLTATANSYGNLEYTFLNYTSSSNKIISAESVSETNGATAYQTMTAFLWSNSNPITSLQIIGGNGDLVFGSTFQLYGLI